jgi:hypothetical protein
LRRNDALIWPTAKLGADDDKPKRMRKDNDGHSMNIKSKMPYANETDEDGRDDTAVDRDATTEAARGAAYRCPPSLRRDHWDDE